MPNWKVHLEVGKRIGSKLKYTEEEMQLFLLGNILLDINNGHIVKDISTVFDHDYTHYKIDKSPTYMQFYKLYKNNINHPIICGCLVHLYTDFLFNKDFYLRSKQSHIGNLTYDELKRIKHSEFRSHNDLYIENKIEINDLIELENHLKLVERVSVNKDDIEKVLEFLNKCEKSHSELKFYNMEELENLMEKTLDKIESLLSTLWIIRRKKYYKTN